MAVSISAAPEVVAGTSAPTSLVSPQHAPKRRKMMPPLTAFQAIKAAHALPAGSFAEAQVGGGSSMPLSSGEIVPPAAGGQSHPLADLISQASAVTVSSTLPSPLFTTAVVQERYQNLTLELEASNAKAQAKQVELEEREEQLRKLQQVCDSLVSEKNQLVQSSTAQQACLKEAESALNLSNAEVDSLTSRLAGLQGDRNWLITNGLVGAFEYLRQSESFVTLLDRLSAAAYKSGHHDGVHEGYVSCQYTGRITPVFQERGGKLTGEMADALEEVYYDPLPAYAESVDKVAEDGVDSLRQMFDVAKESGEE
ncbi:hypothetical protein HanLR1_Chr13g0477651 [Helianthus annuus]|nr:hypothetical protein HanLR1_Chr13g0477651 [Helianthus annuus]